MPEATMIDYHCQSCGAALPVEEGQKLCECLFCGSRWSVRDLNSGSEEINLLKTASQLRQHYEFDRALAQYDKIIRKFPKNLDGYWGAILCKYGIAYVDDPKTGRKIPTCHRTSYNTVTNDPDFQNILKNAVDEQEQQLYTEKANEIEQLRRDVIKISENEPPYDVFICYKESDEHGNRTVDSVEAARLYESLTHSGYRTFFARESLSEHVGEMYEPYIFSALTSAKIMVVIGTKPEYFNAVWVKNEWSRFLSMMATDKKKLLLPCYKDMDGYELPDDLVSLQSADMSKLGWEMDIVSAVRRRLTMLKEAEAKPQPTAAQVQQVGGASVDSIMTFADINRKSGNFDKARANYDSALQINPKRHDAYWGLLLAESGYRDEDVMTSDGVARSLAEAFLGSTVCGSLTPEGARTALGRCYGGNLDNALCYADEATSRKYEGYMAQLAQKVADYSIAVAVRNTDNALAAAKKIEDYEFVSKAYRDLNETKKADNCDVIIAKLQRKHRRQVRHERTLNVFSGIGIALMIAAAVVYFVVFYLGFSSENNKFMDGDTFFVVSALIAAFIGFFMGIVCEIKIEGHGKPCLLVSFLLAIGTVIIGAVVDSSQIGTLVATGAVVLLLFLFVSLIVGLVGKLIAKIVLKISEIGMY